MKVVKDLRLMSLGDVIQVIQEQPHLRPTVPPSLETAPDTEGCSGKDVEAFGACSCSCAEQKTPWTHWQCRRIAAPIPPRVAVTFADSLAASTSLADTVASISEPSSEKSSSRSSFRLCRSFSERACARVLWTRGCVASGRTDATRTRFCLQAQLPPVSSHSANLPTVSISTLMRTSGYS